MTELMRPDRRALLELDSLLGQVELLHRSGSRARFDADRIYRWALHRLWIAAGNEALRYVSAIGRDIHTVQPWARLYQRRNALAHQPLVEIDEDAVWRVTTVRTARYRQQARALLR